MQFFEPNKFIWKKPSMKLKRIPSNSKIRRMMPAFHYGQHVPGQTTFFFWVVECLSERRARLPNVGGTDADLSFAHQEPRVHNLPHLTPAHEFEVPARPANKLKRTRYLTPIRVEPVQETSVEPASETSVDDSNRQYFRKDISAEAIDDFLEEFGRDLYYCPPPAHDIRLETNPPQDNYWRLPVTNPPAETSPSHVSLTDCQPLDLAMENANSCVPRKTYIFYNKYTLNLKIVK
ncbi:hypothetical protein HNY73_005937 [Argiope bruennichi]|uniref:Uncharacterized protein n=1 Tax=Argiope bruennichi TaxID=94029 RepID=A0A8T0FN45_ARGBR|nr:hypothetical protein HNY73_005937 [Argiope bruennichi]